MTETELIEAFKTAVLDGINQIADNTDYEEDTLESFKGRYDGKYVRFRDRNFSPALVTVEYRDPTVVALIEGFQNPIRMAKFKGIIGNGSMILQDHE